jgi:hypothetical protein
MVGWHRRKTKLTAQPHLAERREGGGRLERRESKGKMYFRNYAIDTRAERLGTAYGACGSGEASGLAGIEAEWAARSAGPKVRKKNF